MTDYRMWICSKCGHEVLAPERPQPIHWTDGHVCGFKEIDEKEVTTNAKNKSDG